MDSPHVRRRRFIARWHLTGEEQTSDLLELAERDPERAAYELATSRAGGRRETKRNRVDGGGNKAELRTAQAISRFDAREASSAAVIFRNRILGSEALLTCKQAVALLAENTVEKGGQALSFAAERGRELIFHLDPKSDLAGVSTACYLLTYTFPWTESQAARFLLTGEPPMIPAVKTETNRVNNQGAFRCPITVTLLPHVSDKSVARMINSARRRLAGAPKGPLPEVRRQAMMDFVLELKRRALWRGWPDAHRQWKTIAPPDWRYSHWRVMERAHGHEAAARARIKRADALRPPLNSEVVRPPRKRPREGR